MNILLSILILKLCITNLVSSKSPHKRGSLIKPGNCVLNLKTMQTTLANGPTI